MKRRKKTSDAVELMNKSVLILAAHPDDEVLGCGGTMARLSSEGWDVHIALLAEGISATVALFRTAIASGRIAVD